MQSNLLKRENLYKSLSDFIKDVRDKFEDIEDEANLLTDNRDYKINDKRIRKIKLQFGERSSNDTCFDGRQSFIVNIHNVICEISRRSTVSNDILRYFQVFFNDKISNDKILRCVGGLSLKYSHDIDSKYFKDEVIHFIKYAKEENVSDPVNMYKLLKDVLQSTFPNVETILRIFLTMPICNASGERSFSVLKRVKNYLRNSLSQPHLSNLSFIFIENDVDYESLIDKFARMKARKVKV
ncbi:unnamed protein product [Brassicogethes aeneus]|uniref:HAT C-terminal dimerisation domain-containing protein n=1 Tax=Brassicogethes aeneus TaxID=1431903 RepID=A0A9P0BHC1_BRAAE|nr:unnamed protein product [Brassicogethes aeneus]